MVGGERISRLRDAIWASGFQARVLLALTASALSNETVLFFVTQSNAERALQRAQLTPILCYI